MPLPIIIAAPALLLGGGIVAFFVGKEAAENIDLEEVLNQPAEAPDPKNDKEGATAAATATAGVLANYYKEKDDEHCCKPAVFERKWPVKTKTMANNIKPHIGWNDFKKYKGQVVFQRGWRFQAQTCGTIEYRCEDKSKKVSGRFQWADGLVAGQCWMAEAKYVMPNAKIFKRNLALELGHPRRRKIYDQFERYSIVSNNPRQADESCIQTVVGLRVYVSRGNGAEEYYHELLRILEIHGDVYSVDANRWGAEYTDVGAFEDREEYEALDVDDMEIL